MSADAVVRDEWPAPLDFINEDDLHTFEGWLKYQAIDLAALTAEEAAGVREMFDDAAKRRETTKKVGRMKLKATPDTPSRFVTAMICGSRSGSAVPRRAKSSSFCRALTALGTRTRACTRMERSTRRVTTLR